MQNKTLKFALTFDAVKLVVRGLENLPKEDLTSFLIEMFKADLAGWDEMDEMDEMKNQSDASYFKPEVK